MIKSKKKSQMEIMGLMIVVILLIVGVIFALKFVVLKKPTDTRQEYPQTQMASNFGIALMSTSTYDCRGTQIKTLLTDCAENQMLSGSITCGNGKKSCEYVNNTIEEIINNTLVKWNQKYYFVAGVGDRSEDRIAYFHSETCTAERQLPGESESFFLPTRSGEVLTLTIFVCT